MLSDLTFDMCVPSLRWREAHRMQRKTPSYKSFVNIFLFRRLSHCQPGCVGEDASALTFQLAQPADNVSSWNLAHYGLTDLGSEPDSRRKHHYQEQIVRLLVARVRSALVGACS